MNRLDGWEEQAPYQESSRSGRAALVASVLIYAGLLLFVTMSPVEVVGRRGDPASLCLICGERGLADALLNFLLFVPLGALLARLPPRGFWPSLALAGLASFLIETSQLWIPGRYSTLGDLAFNSLGAASGLFAFHHARPFRFIAARTSGPLSGACLLLVGAALLGSVALFHPAIPDRPVFGQWTPELGGLETYDGRLIDVRIGDDRLDNGYLGRSRALARFVQGESPMTVRFVAGSTPSSLAPIFAVADDRQRGLFLLGVEEYDLVLSVRTRADAIRLDRPDHRLRGGLAGVQPGDTVSVLATAGESGGYRVGVGDRKAVLLGHTPGRVWSLLHYSGHWPEWALRTVDHLCLAVVGLILGWWTSSLPGLLAAAGLLGVGLAAGPALTPVVAASLTEYLTGFAGLLGGRIARHALVTAGARPGDEGGPRDVPAASPP